MFAFDDELMEFLRENFARLHNKLDLLHEDIKDLDVRMMALEAEYGSIRLELAKIRNRLDSMLCPLAA